MNQSTSKKIITEFDPNSYVAERIFSNFESVSVAAESLGLDTSTVYRYLERKRKPSNSVVRSIQLVDFIYAKGLLLPKPII